MISGPELGTCRKVYCNTCRGETHHELKAVHPREYYEILYEGTPNEQPGFWERFEYRLWICRGCDSATLEEAYTNAGMHDPRSDDYVWGDSVLHPKRERTDLPSKRFRQLSPILASIYREVIISYNNRLRLLCAIGLRALLEGVCADKGIARRTLETKINDLDAHLPSNIVKSLHSFRFMGNLAAHELQAPESSELRLAIEVMEDLLNYLYELDYKARKLPRDK